MRARINILILFILSLTTLVWAHEDHNFDVNKDSWSKGYSLMLVDSNNLASTDVATKYIESLGGRISIVIPPRVVLGWIPPSIKNSLVGQHGITFVTDQKVDVNSFSFQDQNSTAGIHFYNYVVSGRMEEEREQGKLQQGEPLSGDVLPNEDYDISTKAITMLTGNSDSMTGTVAVGLFFVESNGAIDPNTYTWNTTDELNTFNRILAGLAWWTAQAPSYGSSVSFLVINNPSTSPICQQPYEPILHASGDDQLWIGKIMTNLNQPSVLSFNTALRANTGRDWAYSAFIAYNPPPAPNKFTNGRSAYALAGGPYTQLLFDSGGWGPQNIGHVFAHETGHIFWACDEYNQPGNGGCVSCGACDSSGPRPTALNRNCEFCNTASVSCMMKNNVHSLCDDTPIQIGWGPLIEIELPNGSPRNDSINGSTPWAAWDYFFVDVDLNQSLGVELSNLTNDADLFIAFDRKPTRFDNDCASAGSGTIVERCVKSDPTPGRWWIGVNNSATGNINYTIKATMTMCAASLHLNPLPLPNVVVAAHVSQDVTTSNGTGPFEFTVTGLSLPPGLSLYLGGWLTGEATTTGTYDFVVQAMDSLGCTGARLYTMNVFTCTANIQASPTTLPNGNVGTPYNRTISGSGGTAPYTFSIFSGTFPPGLFLDTVTGSITGIPTTAGSFPFTIRVSDSNTCFTDIAYTINITIPVCLFCDEFDDNVLRNDVSYLKGNWDESGGSLTGSASGKALAVVMPAFSGCTTCSFESTMKSGGGKVWFFTWYKDSKSYVELLMDPSTDKWTLKQYVNGNVVAKRKVTKTIDPNTVYKVKMIFDGTTFEVYIDDVLSITVATGATPFGTAAFQSKATNGSFGYLRIN